MKSKTFGASFLVAGTAIGGGMLALPLLTGAAGFIPSSVVYFVSWLVMMLTALLYVEIYLWHKKEVNIITMAQTTLGLPGKIFSWIVYLFLFYSLTIAYISGGGLIFNEIFSFHTASHMGSILFVVIFGTLVILGEYFVDRVNRILVLGLILAFLLFLVIGVKQIRPILLVQQQWSSMFVGLPIIVLSFGFQGIVPTLTHYLERDVKEVRKAIILGSAMTLICYLLWQLVILGVIPVQELIAAQLAGGTAINPLKKTLHMAWLTQVGEWFALLAISTSFLGVTLGLLDFLADGLKVKKKPTGRFVLGCVIFLPSLLWSYMNPKLFLQSLQYGGGIGGVLLLVFLPTLMAWRGRYTKNLKGNFRLFGGRKLLIILLLFTAFTLYTIVKSLV